MWERQSSEVRHTQIGDLLDAYAREEARNGNGGEGGVWGLQEEQSGWGHQERDGEWSRYRSNEYAPGWDDETGGRKRRRY